MKRAILDPFCSNPKCRWHLVRVPRGQLYVTWESADPLDPDLHFDDPPEPRAQSGKMMQRHAWSVPAVTRREAQKLQASGYPLPRPRPLWLCEICNEAATMLRQAEL